MKDLKVVVKELQNRQSERTGYLIRVKTLRAAKCHASRARFFQGTTLKIEALDGTLLAIKEPGKLWSEELTTTHQVAGVNLSNDIGPKEWEPDDSNVTCPQICGQVEELWTFKNLGLKEPPNNYSEVKAKYKLIKYMSSYFGNHHPLEGDEVKYVWVGAEVDETSIYGRHGKHSEYVMVPMVPMGLPPLGTALEPLERSDTRNFSRNGVSFVEYSP